MFMFFSCILPVCLYLPLSVNTISIASYDEFPLQTLFNTDKLVFYSYQKHLDCLSVFGEVHHFACLPLNIITSFTNIMKCHCLLHSTLARCFERSCQPQNKMSVGVWWNLPICITFPLNTICQSSANIVNWCCQLHSTTACWCRVRMAVDVLSVFDTIYQGLITHSIIT